MILASTLPSVSRLNQTDLKDAIIKGYYGEEGYSDISLPQDSESVVIIDCYNLQGIRLNAPRQGLNIVKVRNGTVKKVLYK